MACPWACRPRTHDPLSSPSFLAPTSTTQTSVHRLLYKRTRTQSTPRHPCRHSSHKHPLAPYRLMLNPHLPLYSILEPAVLAELDELLRDDVAPLVHAGRLLPTAPVACAPLLALRELLLHRFANDGRALHTRSTAQRCQQREPPSTQQKERRHNDKCSRGGHLADHRLLPFPRLLLTCIISSSVFGFLSLTNLGRGFAAAEPLFGFGFGFSSATASPSAPSSTSTSS